MSQSQLDENASASMSEDGDMDQIVESSNGKELAISEASSDMEPCVGMEFESEEAAKVFYDAYATHVGFIMRVDAFRRSMRDGKVVWRRLVCNKEGFRKLRPRRSENRKPRAVTREGCKAMIVVKKEKAGKWVVTRFVKEHNHPLVPTPANGRRTVLLSQTPKLLDFRKGCTKILKQVFLQWRWVLFRLAFRALAISPALFLLVEIIHKPPNEDNLVYVNPKIWSVQVSC
ncbi:protein FAR1-RELATED SEQUENCE 2-like [Populus alba x Populus x berolinensis]|nr:protein FAR1-RELATED SEQUENCE 2-like [Populus alba x Populus x berolinensis]